MLKMIDPNTHKGVSETTGIKDKTYTYDYVFDTHVDQEQVYINSTQFLISGALDGYNSCAFAYGATGSGKTYTMLGSKNQPGVIAHTFQELFSQIEKSRMQCDYVVKMSFLEIYNENIKDLLILDDDNDSDDDKPHSLELREDPQLGVVINGLQEIKAQNSKEVLDLLLLGNKYRTTEMTDANDESSRSHAMLMVSIEKREKDSGTEAEVHSSKLNMIDLAGSERV